MNIEDLVKNQLALISIEENLHHLCYDLVIRAQEIYGVIKSVKEAQGYLSELICAANYQPRNTSIFHPLQYYEDWRMKKTKDFVNELMDQQFTPFAQAVDGLADTYDKDVDLNSLYRKAEVLDKALLQLKDYQHRSQKIWQRLRPSLEPTG
ncbi:MAG TPA: hypothetical protein VFF28_03560 [Candidatus Nanoarchaeia archaeon]|nr:hypothetical protein [Candidatus Nanoarchaeia archaeon]